MIDIVFHHAHTFDGDAIETRPIAGTETAEIYLSRALAAMGHNVVFFTYCSKPGVYSGVKYMHCDSFNEFVRDNEFKIFIAQTNPEIFREPIKAKVKYYWSEASYTVRRNQLLKDKNVQALINKYIFVSQWQADTFAGSYKLDKKDIFVTRNGVNLSLFNDPSIKKERNRLIYASEPVRGLETLLDIFPHVKKSFPDLSLYVYSDYECYGQKKGAAFDEYKQIFDKTKQPGVHNMGNIKQQELAKELQRTYVLAFPTDFEETSCISALEAQAAGTPVLTTSLAALKETVADGVTGKLISGNPHSWFYRHRFVKELKKLLSNDAEWTRLSENGKKRIKDEYSWDMIARDWEKEFSPYL